LQGHDKPHEIINLDEVLSFYEKRTSEEFINETIENTEEDLVAVRIAKHYDEKEKLKALKEMLKIPFDVVIINQLPDDDPDNILFYP